MLRFATHRPGAVLALCLAVIGVFAFALAHFVISEHRLPVEIEVEKVLPAPGHSAARRHYDRFRERYGNDEVLLVALVDEEVFTPGGLHRIRELTDRFAELEGVQRVSSLATLPALLARTAAPGESLLDSVPEDPRQLSRLRRQVLDNPLLAGVLVGRDARSSAFIIHPQSMSERDFRRSGIDTEVARIAREALDGESGTAQVVLSGVLPIKAATGRLLLRDLARFIPLSTLAMLTVGFITFRSVRGMLVPVVCVAAAQVLLLGGLVMWGGSLNLVTFIVPPVVLAVGFAYAVHVVAEHAAVLRERGERGGPDALARTLVGVAPPVALTALTTAAGFLCLCANRLPAIREFGLLCALGVVASALCALVLAPALLGALPARAPRPGANEWLEGSASRLAAFDLRHRRVLMLGAALLALMAAIGIGRLQLGTSFLDNLKAGDPVRQQVESFSRHLDGTAIVSVLVRGDAPQALHRPRNLKVLRELQDWLEHQPEVDGTSSVADLVSVAHGIANAAAAGSPGLPRSSLQVATLLDALPGTVVGELLTADAAEARIIVRMPHSHDSATYVEVLARIEARLSRLPPGLSATVTGSSALIAWSVDEIAGGQAASLSAAAVIIYLVMAAFFRSWSVAVLALIPNALPVLVYFGLLGLSGITLNVVTSLIACIILGIAVDDTIHFLARYRSARRRLPDAAEAVTEALRTVILPVTATTAALVLGFLVLATSGLRHQTEFGLLAAGMLLFAWVVDLTFTPALASTMHVGRDESR